MSHRPHSDDRAQRPPAHAADEAWTTEALDSPDQAGLDSLEEHPDGWYWRSAHHQAVGPFETREAALADWQGPEQLPGSIEVEAPGEGMAEELAQTLDTALDQDTWVDPETGALADDTRTHLDN